MQETVLQEPDEAIEARKREMRSHFWPILRTVPYGFLLVWLFSKLMVNWGTEMPAVLWTAPFIGVFLVVSIGIPHVYISHKLIFTDKKLTSRELESKSVKWSTVRSWEILVSDSESDYFLLKFFRTFNRSSVFRIHNSYDPEIVGRLVQKYGRI